MNHSNRILLLVVTLLYVYYVAVGVVKATYNPDCKDYFRPYLEIGSDQCILGIISGLEKGSVKVRVAKGSFRVASSKFALHGRLNQLKSHKNQCNSNYIEQPFSTTDISKINISMSSSGIIRFEGTQYQLNCKDSTDWISFQTKKLYYIISLKIFNGSCPDLNFGDDCGKGGDNEGNGRSDISVSMVLEHHWVSVGEDYYLYRVVLMNNGPYDITRIRIFSSNWSPLEKWNIVETGYREYGLPNWIKGLNVSQKWTFNFITKTVDPKFTIDSY
ncbi:hypothetical protein DLAC_10372 [Tieghemostelium lacteum]|uniref:Carbohydrate binding domain-containing protein n=1 Tax=Tieghemostelium lacteum TaxID=361077 RepID=A0A151Z589_TIELA|nr:hypothetical protein DLAC_10372 [Tieghemostelium lacteum]|eukprot:KYQ89132.1 hypothetical protein DLAC_10372 [Tieghemostelium lacteum]